MLKIRTSAILQQRRPPQESAHTKAETKRSMAQASMAARVRPTATAACAVLHRSCCRNALAAVPVALLGTSPAWASQYKLTENT